MKCPICGARLFPGADRCRDCGCHIRAYAAPVEESTHHSPRGRILLALLSLIPALAIIVFTSLIAFSIRTEHEPAIPEPGFEQILTVPTDPPTVSVPEADEGCFSISDGAVTFLPWCHDGSTIVRIPETVDGQNVTALAPGCFSGCDGLTTIVLPDTVRTIGENAFAGCSRLRGLYLPEGTVTVDSGAFSGCLELDAVYIPASMESIAEGCFDDCAGLLYIFYEGTFEDWNELYDDYICPFTAAICLDGSYYHGTGR